MKRSIFEMSRKAGSTDSNMTVGSICIMYNSQIKLLLALPRDREDDLDYRRAAQNHVRPA